MKAAVKKAIVSILQKLPAQLRAPALRRMINLSITDCPVGIEFKVAETTEELREALSLVHDSYLEMGYSQGHASGIRITPYNLLPTTSTLIAKHNGRVVATVSLVGDSLLGLPSDALFDLSALRKNYSRPFEISSLAVRKGWRGRLLFPLLKYFWEYNEGYFKGDVAVQCTTGTWHHFYEDVLLFKPLSANLSQPYQLCNGVRARGGFLDCKNAEIEYYFAYAGKPLKQNLHHFFTKLRMPSFRFPDRAVFKTFDHSFSTTGLIDIWTSASGLKIVEAMGPDYLKKFSDVLSTLTTDRRVNPRNASAPRRQHFRYPVQMEAFLEGERGVHPIGEVQSISSGGFTLKTNPGVHLFPSRESVSIVIQVGPLSTFKIRARMVWSNGQNSGLLATSENWRELVSLVVQLPQSLPSASARGA